MEKKRIIFDLDGTLLEGNYSYEKKYFEEALKRASKKDYFINNIPKFLEEYERTHERYDVDELSWFLRDTSGLRITPDIVCGWCEILAVINSTVIDGVYETLEYLKKEDKSLVVLTNWFLGAQLKRLERAGLAQFFDGIYGGEMAIKPTARSYLQACSESPIEQCVIVGDSLETDVYGANKIGLDAVYYNPNNTNNFDKNKVKSIGSIRRIKEMF